MRRFILCLAGCAALSCAGGRIAAPAPAPGVVGQLLEQPPGRRTAAITDFVRAARPRVRVEAVDRAPIERSFGALLPIGLEDFEFVRVVVEQDDPAVVLDASVAFVPTPSAASERLPMFVPTREFLRAFTGERGARPGTHYRLRSAGLPLFLNLITVGVLELLTVQVDSEQVQPSEADEARASPRAHRLAQLLDPPHDCAPGASRCERLFVLPRIRDDVPLRLELDVALGDVTGATVRAPWSIALPAGKPLALRLDAAFDGAPIVLTEATTEPARARGGCRLSQAECAPPKSAPAGRAPEPAIAIAPERWATASESLAARPSWWPHDGYAPDAHLDAIAPEEWSDAAGPLDEVMLVCELELPLEVRPERLVVEARVAGLPLLTPRVEPRYGERPRVAIPLVQLERGQKVELAIHQRTRFLVWTTDELLGRPKAVYDGTLPLVAKARRVKASCGAIGRAAVEHRVAAQLEALRRALGTLEIDSDPIRLDADDWGFRDWGMAALQGRIAGIAGLVGWSDPRVHALLPVIEHYHDVFVRYLGRYLAAKRETLPAPGTVLEFEAANLRVIGPRCGPAIDRRTILWSRERVPETGCVTEIEVTARGPETLAFSPRTGSLGAIWSADLGWQDGRRSDAWTVGVRLDTPGKRRPPDEIILHSGESVRLFLAPEAPLHREGEPGPMFLIGLDGLDTVLVRLD